MFKNIIIEKGFISEDIDQFTNDVTYQIPYTYLGYVQYKIESMKVSFSENMAYVDNLIVTDEKNEPIQTKTIQRYADILNYNLDTDRFLNRSVEVCYVVGDKKNNAELTLFDNKKIAFNLICCTFQKHQNKNEFVLDSDWQDYTEKLHFSFYDQEFRKIAINNIYINIKLRYDQ